MSPKKSILLVEDEALIAMNEAAMLTKHGYKVIPAYNAQKALDTVKKTDIDLVLMDIDLGRGKMDGTEAAEIILKDQELPIVFLTSHSEKEYVDKVKGITGYGYVLKNSGEFVLIESISMAFELFEAHQKSEQENVKRKKIEESLREEQAELSAIYKHTPVLMIIVDKERRIRKANAFATEFAGAEAEDLIGKRGGEALRCVHHLDDPRGCGFGPYCGECKVRRTVMATFERGKSFKKLESTLPLSIQGKEKAVTFLLSTSYLEIKGEPCVIVSIEDITERKRLEERLRESGEKFQSVFSSSPDAMVLANRETGIIVEANQTAADLFKTPLNELIGMHHKDLHPAEEQDRAKKTFKYKPNNGEHKAPPVEIEIKNADKETRITEIRGRILIINDEEYVLGNFRDITERKRWEAGLRKAIEGKDFLMRELNHRVKNNLIIISSLIGLKENALGGRVDLSDIRDQINAIRIVHEKLFGKDDISHIDFADYADDLLETIFSSFSEKPVKIENTMDACSLPTKTAVALGLIINEIATNAIKHGFVPEEEARFLLKLKEDRSGGEYVLTVSNSGRAFPEDVDLDHPETLGLRLISALVEQLSGSIDLKRNPHPVFTIRFPADLS